jgi:prevent-host-death family protein
LAGVPWQEQKRTRYVTDQEYLVLNGIASDRIQCLMDMATITVSVRTFRPLSRVLGVYTYNPHIMRSRESVMTTDDAVTVSAAEFHRNVGVYQDIALTKPVTITKNGRERTVLLSAQEYARLKRRDRRVIPTGELSERQVNAIRNARVPDQYSDLDNEIKD